MSTQSALPLSSAELNSLESLLPYATAAELERIQYLLTGAEPPLWSPLPDKNGLSNPQRLAYESTADVLCYGGAGGGGKTDLILGLAIMAHKRSIVFRRESTQGRGLFDRLREILGDVGRPNENTGIWRLPGGRQIELGGVKDPGDEHRWKGRPHDLIAFDEADQFTEHQVRFLLGWLRTTDPNQRCRAVLGFNPPSTVDGRWLLDFIKPWLAYLFPSRFTHDNPAAPGELRWYATVDRKEVERPNGEPFENKGELITPRSRTFIPAKVTDNEHLMRTGYLSTLQAMAEPMRSQLLYGDFAAGLEDDAWQVIPTSWLQAAFDRWVKLDRERPGPPANQPMTSLGVDVARGGRAKTVLAPRYATWFGPLHKYAGPETPDGPSVARLIVLHHRDEADVNLDMTYASGQSAFDQLKTNYEYLRATIHAVNSAARLKLFDRSGRFPLVNVRAALYWRLREALDPHNGDDLAICPDHELMQDLTSAKWELTASGIKVEPKEDIEERLGRSVDSGDAVMLAHWLSEGGMVPDSKLLAAAEDTPRRRLEPDEQQSRAAERGHFGRGR